MRFLTRLMTSISLFFSVTLTQASSVQALSEWSGISDTALEQFTPQKTIMASPLCLVYPFIARDINIGSEGSKIDILDGSVNDHFGWLAWNPDNSAGSAAATYLSNELRYSTIALNDFTDARDSTDHILSVGDYVTSMRGVNSHVEISDGLITALIGREIIIPVWDIFSSSPPASYHISSFALVRIENSTDIADFVSFKNIFATYLGPVDLEQCPYLTLTKSGPATAKVGEPITYTLTLTNSGNLTATNLIMTDAIPANASFVTGGTMVGNVVSWTVPSLSINSSLTRTFSVTASQTITNNNYQVRADDDVGASGVVTAVTVISPELTIVKTGPLSATANSLITYTLQVTNSGGLATHLVITDAIPTNASYVNGGTLVGNVVSWTVPSLSFGGSLACTFRVTASQTITNSDYRVNANGNINATGVMSVVTIINADNNGIIPVYLPVIFKN